MKRIKIEKNNFNEKDKKKVITLLGVIFFGLLVMIAFIIAALIFMNSVNYSVFGLLFMLISVLVLLTACPAAVIASRMSRASAIPLQTVLPPQSPVDVRHGNSDGENAGHNNNATERE